MPDSQADGEPSARSRSRSCSPSPSNSDSRSRDPIRVLAYSDLESAFDDPARVGALAGLIEARRDERTLVAGAGDDTALGVLSLLTGAGRGQARPFFERVAPDVETLGNHDLDHGREWALEWAESVPATYCCANVEGPGADRLPDGTVRRVDGRHVGVVGVAHPETADICGTIEDLSFGDPVAAARRAFADLPDHDVRVVVAHCGARDPDVAAGVDADAVVGGHLHESRVDRIDGTLFVRTAGSATELAELTLGSEPSVTVHEVPGADAGRFDDADADPLDDAGVDRFDGAGADPFDGALASTYRERRAALGVDEVVARVEEPRRRTERERFGGESRLGNFAADSFRAAADADAALFPAGSLRTGPPLSGEVTAGEVIACCPFGAPVVTCELDGAALRAVLAAAGEPHPGDRGWVQFHVSGLEVTWTDDDRLQRVAVGGDPLDRDRTYRVATAEYSVVVDAFEPLERESVVAEHDEQWRALVDHARRGGLSVGLEGRIERTSATSG